jgi:hypothetical protein
LGCDRNQNVEEDDDAEEADNVAPDKEGVVDAYLKAFRKRD